MHPALCLSMARRANRLAEGPEEKVVRTTIGDPKEGNFLKGRDCFFEKPAILFGATLDNPLPLL